MQQFDKELKTYSENGLRSVEEWGSLGRQVEGGAEPCTHATSRGVPVALYTRAQTRLRPRAERPRIAGGSTPPVTAKTDAEEIR